MSLELKTPLRRILHIVLWPFRGSWIKKISFVVIIIGIAWYIYSQQTKTFEVEVAEVAKKDITDEISASGEITAKEAVNLTFQTGGKLNWVGVSEGMEVRRGQAIASLDRKQLEQTLRKYLNSFEREFSDFYDSQDSVKDEVLTDAVRRIKSRSQIDLNQTVLDVEIQSEAIKLATLYSPITGIVTKANPEFAGVNVTPATTAYEIVNPTTVYFEADVNEVDIARIQTGLPVEIELDAYPNELIKESVSDISFTSKTTSTGATAYTVKIPLPENNDYRYRLGMNGDVRFLIEKRESVYIIPQTAVIEDGSAFYVWTVEEGIAKKKEIKEGLSSIDEVEVIEGLREGEIVILRPSKEIVEGLKVKKKE